MNEENLKQIINESLSAVDDSDMLLEAVAKKSRRVRGGKVVRKRKCPHGFKLSGTRCVRQGSRERITRSKAGRKSARKGKSARKRNFAKSTRLRQRRNLKRVKLS